MNKEINIENKVIIDIDKYVHAILGREKSDAAAMRWEQKYFNLVKYILSECEILRDGEEYKLKYDNYNNHLVEYVKSVEPVLYRAMLDDILKNKEIKTNED